MEEIFLSAGYIFHLNIENVSSHWRPETTVLSLMLTYGRQLGSNQNCNQAEQHQKFASKVITDIHVNHQSE